MRSRAQFIIVFLAIAFGIAGCHKQAPPVTEPAPVSSGSGSSGPGPRGSVSAPSVPATPADNGAAEAARRKTAEAILVQMIHFDYNQAVLRPEDKAVLDAKASLLKANPDARIRITGHCDERGSDQYNIALGMRRATAAKEYLTVLGIEGARIEMSSLGREQPLDPGHSEESWARNRRDEFMLTAGSVR